MEKVSFQIDDRTTLQDRVTAAIRKAILQGYWKDGEKIRQEDISQLLNVSRMPVREALKQLSQEGLLTFAPHRGAVVNQISNKDIVEVYELRSRLESFCVELAGPNLDDHDFSVLEKYNSLMGTAEQQKDMEKYTVLNREFHFYLYKKSDWRRLVILITTLWNGLPPHAPSLLPNKAAFSNDDHKNLIGLLRERRFEEASQLMADHIMKTGAEIQRYYLQQERN